MSKVIFCTAIILFISTAYGATYYVPDDYTSIQAAIEDQMLVVMGDRSLPQELGRVFVHRMELPLGRFERKIRLPCGRYHDVRFVTDNGCLMVTLSKVI